MADKKVVIAIHGGCASLISAPDDVEVEIRDFDVQQVDEEDITLKKDADGDRYQSVILD